MRYLFFTLTLFPYFLGAQTCTGSLGDNIFTAGDFGTGSANVLLPNPNIAPDYLYNTTPPPGDGQYVVTNNTAAWGGLFPTWLALGDNSTDPGGYMMVINADFEPGLFYDQEIDGLCGNTLYEFSADIINLIRIGVPDHIEPNVSFLIDDVVQFTTGDIPATETWETFGFTFTTDPGQTGVRLSLRNNAPGGIGNDLALDNLSFRPCGDEGFILPDEPANICEDGEPLELTATISGTLFTDLAIQWQSSPDGVNDWADIPGATNPTYLHTQLTAGTYYYRFLIADGVDNLMNERCRLNSNVKVIVVLPKEYSLTDTICGGLSYPVGNSAYTVTGSYIDSLTSSIGCDSIVFTELTVLPAPDLQPVFDTGSPECFDQSNGQITVTSVLNGYPPYTYEWQSGLSTTNVLADVPGNMAYDLRITDRYGCQLDTSVFLPAPGSISLDLGTDQALELGETLTLTGETDFPVTTYAWSSSLPAEPLPCLDCPLITWIPTQSQTVYLTATDALGCSVTDSVLVTVTPVYDLYVPNAFSPNQDGINDRFSVYGRAARVDEIISFRVFDRWGKIVYQAEAIPFSLPGDGWDGRIAGRPAAPGVYAYVIVARFLDGTVRTVSGDVTLLR